MPLETTHSFLPSVKSLQRIELYEKAFCEKSHLHVHLDSFEDFIKQVQRSAHWYDLKEINVESANQILLRFKVFNICFEHPDLQKVLKTLRQAIQKITMNYPIHLLPTLNLPESLR